MVKKSASWVNFGSILKDGEEKEKDKKAAWHIFKQVKQVFIFPVLQAVFICQAVPAAVTALQCCFQHIWFVHAAIQGVSAAKAHLSPPRDYTQLWVWWLSNTAMGAMDTYRYIHSPQGNHIPGTGIGWGTEPCWSTYSSTSENFVSAVRGTVCLCSLSHLISTIAIPCASQSNLHYLSWGRSVAAMLSNNPVPWASSAAWMI